LAIEIFWHQQKPPIASRNAHHEVEFDARFSLAQNQFRG
jgi:hypothetical protein